jgi:predicted membrane chloride channel (bestrophin family)
LSRCIGGAERIHQTVVPLNYARHTLRALTLWLLTLPFALVKDLQLGTGPVLFLVAWLLFGVYEIGVRIEDPFQGTLRLSIMCDMVRRDVLGDETIRASAFELEIEGEPVNGEDADDEEESEEDKDFEMD